MKNFVEISTPLAKKVGTAAGSASLPPNRESAAGTRTLRLRGLPNEFVVVLSLKNLGERGDASRWHRVFRAKGVDLWTIIPPWTWKVFVCNLIEERETFK